VGRLRQQARHKFIGAIGPDVKTELLQTADWKKQLEAVQHPDLLSFMREWRDPARTQVPVSKSEELTLLVGPLADDLVAPLTEDLATWQARCADLSRQIVDAVQLAVEEREDADENLD
jgi:hypothetical protein